MIYEGNMGNNERISQLVDYQSVSKMWITFLKILTKVFGYLNISSYLYIYQTTKRYGLPS